LRELTLLDLLLELRQIDVRGVLAAGIDELIDKERARNDEQPKDDLSCSGTQNLPASVAHDTVNRLPLSLLNRARGYRLSKLPICSAAVSLWPAHVLRFRLRQSSPAKSQQATVSRHRRAARQL